MTTEQRTLKAVQELGESLHTYTDVNTLITYFMLEQKSVLSSLLYVSIIQKCTR